MNVFVLGTGRCGTMSFMEACKHITNYSTAHESLSRTLGSERFAYPDFHIEADNRLSWFTGELEKTYGKQAIYVHLTREETLVAKSFMRRFSIRNGIMYAYVNGIKMMPPELLNKEERLQACFDYVHTVKANIAVFFKATEARHMEMRLENIAEDFVDFWHLIGAEGDLDAALATFKTKHNASTLKRRRYPIYHFKLWLYRHYRRWQSLWN